MDRRTLAILASSSVDVTRVVGREASWRGYLPDSFKVASTKKDEIWTRFYPLLDK
jgi:hypothetical protein